MRLLWASHGLINGYGISLHLNFPITTATMAFLLLYSIDTIATKKGELNFF